MQQVQISRGQVLVPQPRQGRHNVRRERAVPENVRSYTTQLGQIETTRSVFEGGGNGLFKFGDMSSDETVFSDSDWKRGNRQARESRSWDDCLARSSAEAELYAAAMGASEAEGIESMMRDLGFAYVKATEHILHQHGIGKNETHQRGAFGVAG